MSVRESMASQPTPSYVTDPPGPLSYQAQPINKSTVGYNSTCTSYASGPEYQYGQPLPAYGRVALM